MTLVIIAKNQSNKAPEFPINNGVIRTVVQPTIWYVCPVGKKAFVKGIVQCTGRGAASTVDMDIAGITSVRWTSAMQDIRIADYGKTHRNQVPSGNNIFISFEVDLVAGQDIETNQSSGDNAEINMYATVRESDV